MKAYDFEYDGYKLSDFGFMLCNIGRSGVNTISNGSQITFNKVSTRGGSKYHRISSTYDDCLESTFYICKKPCETNDYKITISESREIMKWLNRKDFHKFKILNEEYSGIYFNASFNVNKIEYYDEFIGFELEMQTDRPYGLFDEKTFSFNGDESDWKCELTDVSDEEGYVYPEIEITIGQNGNLSVNNSLDSKEMYIGNCMQGEVIVMKYPVVSTSNSEHKLQDDFNWEFVKVMNDYKNKVNVYTVSLPCTIKIVYSPIAKVSI